VHHGVQRHHVIGQQHARRRARRLHADVLEDAEAEEVLDRLAHGGHGERLTGLGLDDVVELGIAHRPTLAPHEDGRHGFVEEVRDISLND